MDNFGCVPVIEGCMDQTVFNFNPSANVDDGSCLLGCSIEIVCCGAPDPTNACPYYDNSEIYDFFGCDVVDCVINDGCLDPGACNYDSSAWEEDGSCFYPEIGYDCDGNITEYIVGMEAEGGIVFYLDDTGQHGLVAAMEDLTEGATIDSEGNPGYQWGCFAMWLSGADGQAIGTGYQNTLDIASGCSETPIAASEALEFESENHSDWYLPSLDELKEMFNTIGNAGSEGNIGGFSSNWYWSSSESNNYGAYDVNFSDGSTGNFSSKTKIVRVRVIRSF